MLWLSSTALVAHPAMRAAEGWQVRQPVQSAPRAKAIVVLSGGRVQPPGDPSATEWTEAVDRFEAGVELYKAGKAPFLVLTGGWLPWQPEATPEGEVLAADAVARGVPQEQILVTAKASTTAEEAHAVAQLLQQEGLSANKEPVILVTSAYHMRRAELLFAQAGIEVVPFPVDFQIGAGGEWTILDLLPDADNLADTELALREFYGYWYYRIVGRPPCPPSWGEPGFCRAALLVHVGLNRPINSRGAPPCAPALARQLGGVGPRARIHWATCARLY